MLEYKGESQEEGWVGKPLDPFQVKLTDDEGNGIPHVPVTFKVAEGKGEFTYVDERTDLSGSAIAEFVPAEDGRYRIECFIADEMVPFKGVVNPDRRRRESVAPPPPAAAAPASDERPAEAPKRKRRASRRSVPKPEPAPSAAPQADSPPAPAPVAAPPPAPVPVVVIVTPPVMAAPVPAKPQVPAKAPAPRPAIAPATARPRTAPPKPVRRASPRPKPRTASPPPWLVAAVLTIAALMAALSGVLVYQTMYPPRPVVECSGAWTVAGDALVFQGCAATTRR